MSERTGYHAAWWLPGPHAQTMWGKLFRRVGPVPARLLRVETPDGDFVELLRLQRGDSDGAVHQQRRLLILHGLEGSRRSHYAQGLLRLAYLRGWGADLLLFRSCGSEMNRTRRFYHSGDTGDVAHVADRVLAEFPRAQLGVVGISLGGNVLLKWLGESGDALPVRIRAAAAISVPYDLSASATHISHGFARVYQEFFLRSLRRKVSVMRGHFADLPSDAQLQAMRTLRDFDDRVTAPVHGFAGAEDYYQRSSAVRWISGVRRPALLLSARDDPFLPRAVLERVSAAARDNEWLRPEFTDHGGHVGFVGGANPLRPEYYAELRALSFLDAHMAGEHPGGVFGDTLD